MSYYTARRGFYSGSTRVPYGSVAETGAAVLTDAPDEFKALVVKFPSTGGAYKRCIRSFLSNGTRVSFNDVAQVGHAVVTAAPEFFEDLYVDFESAVTLSSITVAPTTSSLSLAGTDTVQLVVTAHYSDSSTAVHTVDSTYASSDQTKATVSSGGLVTGVAAGSATITATYQTKTATCAVTVTA